MTAQVFCRSRGAAWSGYAVALLSVVLLGSACSADGRAPTEAADTSIEDELDPKTEEAIEVAKAFITARDRRDLDTTLALVSPDAEILDFGFWPRTPDEYDGLFQWMEILDWSWKLEGCEQTPRSSGTISCSHEMENEWSRAQGVDAVTGQFTFVVESGVITSINSDIGTWIELVFRPWAGWVVAEHPDDVPVMLRLDEDGEFTGGPATTPEALALYRTYVPEYVDALAAE